MSKVLKTKTHKEKTKRDVKLLNDFLRGEKKEERELSAITPEDLDRYLAEFIRPVRCKGGGEPSRGGALKLEKSLGKRRTAFKEK